MTHPARRALLLCVLTVLVTIASLWMANPRRTRTDIVQQRATAMTDALSPGFAVSQTFPSRQNGLQAIELQMAAGDGTLQPAGTRVSAVLERLDVPGEVPVQLELVVAGPRVDKPLWLQFSPLTTSAGGLYRLTIACPDQCALALRASAEDSLAGGTLSQNGSPVDRDLAMTTYYSASFRVLVADINDILARSAPGLLAALLLLGGPGLAGALAIVGRSTVQPAVLLGTSLTAGLAFWPLVLLWMSTVGIAVTRGSALIIVLASVVFAAVTLRRRVRAGASPLTSTWDVPQTVLMVIMTLAIVLRLIQARELLAPAWADSVHHTMLATLIAENGVVPVSGAPYVQVESLHYHYGFHAVAGILSWLSSSTPAESVLLLGQLLSALAGLSLYALAMTLASRLRSRPSLAMRWSGTLAAAVPAFLTYMPAYYVSWGRYTQLMGLVMLPVILALSMRLLDSGWRTKNGVVLASLVGALAVTHYRVVFYYGLFWVACAVLALLGALRRPRGVRSGASVAWVAMRLAGLTLVVVAPWAIHLARSVLKGFGQIYGSWAAAPGVDTSVPSELLLAGNTEWVLAAAGLGLACCVVGRRWWAVAVGLWTGICLLVSDPTILGLRGSWFVHGTSAMISYWLPAGLFVGLLVAELCFAPVGVVRVRVRQRLLTGMQIALACSLAAGATYALWSQADVVNSRTVLVQPSDKPAIAWAREHLPEDSLVLINTASWQKGLPMGSDAGWWLPYLAEIRVTYPSVLFTQGAAPYRNEVLALAETVQQAEDLSSPAFVKRLTEAGVTHVFVGTRGGPLLPERLHEPHYVELYRNGPTRVYRFDPVAP